MSHQRNCVMGRNRNDSSSGNHGGGSYQPPIEQYRKRIGRQDSHKERRHLKQVQHSQEAKSMAPKIYQQAVIVHRGYE